MFYSINLKIKQNKSSLEFIVGELNVDKNHPLVKTFGLKPGSYALDDFIPPDRQEIHLNLIGKSLASILKFQDYPSELSVNSNPMFSKRFFALNNLSTKEKLFESKILEPMIAYK